MIRVTVELISARGPERNQLLGIAEISNDVQTTLETRGLFGAYDVRTDIDPEETLETFDVRLTKREPKHRETWKRGRVERFPRKTRGAWDLLYLALKVIVGGRNP